MCLFGQSRVYEEASELLEETLNVEISGMQIQRVCEYYGGVIDKAVEKNLEVVLPKVKDVKQNDHTYVMIDGSMLLTREEKWKETKLARIFNERSNCQISNKRNTVLESIYVSHMGSVDRFFPKLERYLCGYNKKVIIGDGAKWIWNWVDDNYPGAVQILDYYHAKEKLVLLAKAYFKDEGKSKDWLNQQQDLLFENGVETVMSNVKNLKPRTEETKSLKYKLLQYYEEHEDRMQYGTYRQMGLLIGSGPIEAAHRSVLQDRMKLSGQKWSISGANAMANLRCYKKSNAWDCVKTLILAA